MDITSAQTSGVNASLDWGAFPVSSADSLGPIGYLTPNVVLALSSPEPPFLFILAVWNKANLKYY